MLSPTLRNPGTLGNRSHSGRMRADGGLLQGFAGDGWDHGLGSVFVVRIGSIGLVLARCRGNDFLSMLPA